MGILPPVGRVKLTPTAALDRRVMAPYPGYPPKSFTGRSARMNNERVQLALSGPHVPVIPVESGESWRIVMPFWMPVPNASPSWRVNPLGVTPDCVVA